jgi:hypothetical protein
MKIDWHAIRELAVAQGRPIKTLYVLSSFNDPFYLGEDRMEKAQWFARLYHGHGFGRGIHTRRIHYRLISQREPVLMPGGSNYENTEKCYDVLNDAASAARYADLVAAGDFVDRRNPEPMLFLAAPVDEPSVDVLGDDDEFYATAPSLSVSVSPGYMPDELPKPKLYISAPCPSPYHVEIWCEKSTVNDVLVPLARRYRLNLQTSVGEISLTLCWKLVERTGGRPVRILYLSDFDPGGQSMPVAAARKIEFFARKHENETGIALDIQLHPIVLTHDQCLEYELPRTPIKETESRSAKFEARFGEGATELDALEALHPGELERILVAEIERFHSPNFTDDWESVRDDAQGELDEIESEIFDRHADTRAALAQRCADLEAATSEQVAELQRFVDERTADLRILADERFAGLAQQGEQLAADVNAHIAEIEQDLESEAPDADDFEWPELPEGWTDPLLDCTRDYVSQVNRFKSHQGKLTQRKEMENTAFVCTVCGTAFTAAMPWAKYCSALCRHRAGDRKRRPRGAKRVPLRA